MRLWRVSLGLSKGNGPIGILTTRWRRRSSPFLNTSKSFTIGAVVIRRWTISVQLGINNRIVDELPSSSTPRNWSHLTLTTRLRKHVHSTLGLEADCCAQAL